jgi:hypothetical protein
MAEQVIHINIRPIWARLPLVLLALAALLAGWWAVRRGIGGSMAEYAPFSYAKDPASSFETAESAARLAPEDPQSHLTLARLHQISFDPAELPRALEEYERAAALAPNDYRIWMEMGRARAALGDTEGGVASLRHAVELAPNYTQPHWHLGNALLRTGRTDEAFAELRRAADIDPNMRPQVFNLAWQVYDQNMEQVINAVGKTPAARAQLVGVLVGRQRFDDAIAVWSALSAQEKREQSAAGEILSRSLYERGQFHRALEVVGESGTGAQSDLLEKVSNGSFESDIGQPGRHLFQWQVSPATGAQVAVDARTSHAGQRSLRILFESTGQMDFRNVWQFVAVQPATRYRLSYFVRASELTSAATLVTTVSDAATDSVALAVSEPVAVGTYDWRQMSVDFTTGAKTEAVVMRLVRVGCITEACPIFGKIWYDDFDLQRADGRANIH